MPAGITAECPSEEIVTLCETGPVVFGVTLPGWDVTVPCDAESPPPDLCPMASGECAQKRASAALRLNP